MRTFICIRFPAGLHQIVAKIKKKTCRSYYRFIFNCYVTSSTHNSSLQFEGRLIRFPDFKYEAKYSTGTVGYGILPSVTISYSRIPYDHLNYKNKKCINKS